MVKDKISITIKPHHKKEIRKIQARLLNDRDETWSFSEVLGIAVDAGLVMISKRKSAEFKKEKRPKKPATS